MRQSRTIFGERYSALGNLTPLDEARTKKSTIATMDKTMLVVWLLDKNHGTTKSTPVSK